MVDRNETFSRVLAGMRLVDVPLIAVGVPICEIVIELRFWRPKPLNSWDIAAFGRYSVSNANRGGVVKMATSVVELTPQSSLHAGRQCRFKRVFAQLPQPLKSLMSSKLPRTRKGI